MNPRPWWREPMIWLVIAPPLAAVLAGVVTLVIAVRRPDPLIAVEVHRTPAVQARNHAATPPGARP